jgi:hypothetical protein
MKKVLIGLMTAAAVIIAVHVFAAQKHEYVGVDKCKMCHKSDARGAQFTKWEKRGHSISYDVLTQDISLPIAKQMDVENPAESPGCLNCHAPLFDKAPEFKEEGVTCEVCHGPGSDYKSLSIMKDHEKAAANGLIEYKNQEDIKQQCLTCHENAHGIAFDFEASWELIQHYRPDQK